MITVTIALLVIVIIGAVVCLLPVLALPLLDVFIGAFVIWRLCKLIKKLFKKDEAE